MNYWLYFALLIALVVFLNIIVGVHARLKPKKYEKKSDFSWDSLDNDGGSRKRDDN